MNTRHAAGLVVAFLLSFSSVHAANRYVDLHCATPLSPFLSWNNAATNIQDAVDVALPGETIWVTNGQYFIRSQILVTNGVRLLSVNGATNTIIDTSNSTRCVYLSHSNAVIDGFTIQHGSVSKVHYEDREYGGGVFCENGTIRNCRIRNNTATAYYHYYVEYTKGAGVFMRNGLLERSLVVSNTGVAAYGVGVYLAGGEVRNCIISHNLESGAYPSWGVGVGLVGGVVRHCVIARNSTGIEGVEVEQVLNSVILQNVRYDYSCPSGTLSFCCSTPTPFGIGNMSNDPSFVSWDSEDFHLQSGSPCIDRGTTLQSPTQDMDHVPCPLDGNGDGYAVPDIGAYEYRETVFSGLTNGGVVPSMGMTNTTFGFSVGYQGETGAATNVVLIDGATNAMTLAFGATTSGIYSFSKVLPEGNHSFRFEATDSTGGTYRLPPVGDFNGPFVSSLATLSNGVAAPTNVDCKTPIGFQVKYNDAGGTSPATNYVYVDSTPYPMSLTNGTATNGLFESDLVLPVGTHTYYFYSVDALMGEYRFPASGAYSDIVVYSCIAAPSNVVASPGTYTNRISVTWNPTTNTTGYEFWKGPSNVLALAVRIVETNLPSVSDAAVTQDTYYYYWVRATNQNVQGDFSTSAVGFASYPPPSFVTASDGAYTDEIALAWTAVGNVTTYQVWRNTTTNTSGAGLVMDGVTATNYDDFLIENGLLFYYWVKSKGSLGNSPFGASDSGFAPVTAPANVTASDGTYTDSVVVSWDAASRATSYEIWWSQGTDTGTCSQIGGSSASPYADSEITPGQGGFYWVKSRNALGPSWFSDPDYGSRDGTGAVPEEIRMVKGADSRSAIFQCESLTGRHYTVEVATNLFGEWVSNSVTAVAGNGRWMNCATSDISSQLFYRVVSGTNN